MSYFVRFLAVIFTIGIYQTGWATAAQSPSQPQAPVQVSQAQTLALPTQIAVQVSRPSAPLLAMNRAFLVYELYLTNYEKKPLQLDSLQISASNPAKNSQFLFNDQQLPKMVQSLSVNESPENSLILQPGMTKLVFIWLPFEQTTYLPTSLVHRIQVHEPGRTQIRWLTTKETKIQDSQPTIIAAPLEGDRWAAGGGPSNDSYHRRAHMVIDGHDYFAQRYAIDFVKIDNKGMTYHGNKSENKNYYCYGQSVLAVSNGRVIAIKDGIPENVPQSGKTVVPIDLNTVGGNYIVIDIGYGRYAFYAHLIPGSLQVKVGDIVRKGQVIAKVGNTGNSTEPHLHFHVVDGPSFLAANGVPYAFDQVAVYLSSSNQLPTGEIQYKLINNQSVAFVNQLVLENAVVKFPSISK